MRRSLVVLAAISGVAVLALPAQAKGIATAHITGPGLGPSGLTIRADAGQFFQTDPFAVNKADRPYGITMDQLGPKYTFTFGFDSDAGQIRQDLYPYAKGDVAWTYTPDQDTPLWTGGRVWTGWLPANPGFREFLFRQGLPRTAPKVASSEVSKGGSSLALAGIIGGAGALVFGAALTLGRRRRSSKSER